MYTKILNTYSRIWGGIDQSLVDSWGFDYEPILDQTGWQERLGALEDKDRGMGSDNPKREGKDFGHCSGLL